MEYRLLATSSQQCHRKLPLLLEHSPAKVFNKSNKESVCHTNLLRLNVPKILESKYDSKNNSEASSYVDKTLDDV